MIGRKSLFRWSEIRESREAYPWTTSAVPSVLQLSTTRYRQLSYVWARTLSMHSSR
jgi:hypothetical protein